MSSPSAPVPIPSSTKEITPEWVLQVTGHVALKEDFHIQGDIQEGFGSMSSICRVSYKTANGDSHQIIVKLLPPDNSKWLEFALADETDEREILFYSTVLPDLLHIIPEIRDNICLVYNGSVVKADPATGRKRVSMLVMDDLQAAGFKMMEFGGIDSDHVNQGLAAFMAKVHFGALAIEVEKGIPLPKLYPFLQGIADNNAWLEQSETIYKEGWRLLEVLLTSQNMEHVLDKFLKIKPLTPTIVRKTEENGRKNPCLVHCDMWPPNIQIHDSLPVKVLDWQMIGYKDVTYDLSIMLLSVLTKENLTKANLRTLLKKYHDEFEELCVSREEYGNKIKRRRWEEFEEFFFTWGITFGFMIFLPWIESLAKDYAKYANLFRVMSEEIHLPEFLESACS